MISYIEARKNKEIGKLIEYGYYLHEREMGDNYYEIPSFKPNYSYELPIKIIENGGIFGIQRYSSHSQSDLCTTIGLCVGKLNDGKFDFYYAQMFQTNNHDFSVHGSSLKISEKQNHWYKTLDYDLDGSWYKMSADEKVNFFVKCMEVIGFKKQDVLEVIKGNMTARQAYMNIAPDNIKNLQWVDIDRRHYVFDNNIAIKGNFGSMYMDDFPFPFVEQPILDCSKVKTCYIRFDNNFRKVKLINVNENPDSIKYTNLKNAIIDEPIDLSRVNAEGTRFGHQTVINLEYSIANLNEMDLTLAVNEDGKRYEVDEKGIVQFDNEFTPKTIENNCLTDNISQIEIFSNADNSTMAKMAAYNGAYGIGLVRTEHIFQNIEDIERMIDFLTNYIDEEEKSEALKRLREMQAKQAKEILTNFKNKKVIFRLLDFNLKEYLRITGLSCDWEDKYINPMRGAALLEDKKEILRTQLEAIFEEASKLNVEINLLVPMIRNLYEFIEIKKEIMEVSKKYDLKNLKIGAMIENIEMSNDADLLAKEADFISIGTNDLTESITGLSRDTNSVEFHELTEEVKSTIKEIIYRARAVKPDVVIGICGEHSNYIENIQFYNNIGINYITCNPEFIIQNKEFLSYNFPPSPNKVKLLTKANKNLKKWNMKN